MEQPEPCPTCGSPDGKQWKMLSGQPVCDECWLDVAMDIQQHHFSAAKLAAAHHPHLCQTGTGQVTDEERSNPGNVTTPQRPGAKRAPTSRTPSFGIRGVMAKPVRWRGPDPVRAADSPQCKVRWQETLADLVRPTVNSLCLLCGRWVYGFKLDRCGRCGGLCRHYSDQDMDMMAELHKRPERTDESEA